MPELVTPTGDHFPLPADSGLIGRRDPEGRLPDPDVDLGIVAGGRTVSRRHIVIYRTGPDWHLKVHSSARNATVVSGQALGPEQDTVLNDGDEITLGTVSVTFRTDDAPPVNPFQTVIRNVRSTAEFRGGPKPVVVPPWGGRRITLGRRSDDGKYQPDVDLRDVPRGGTISRRHGLLYLEQGKWHLRVEAETTNHTFHNGAPLRKGAEVELNDGDELRMGDAVATFHTDAPLDYADPKLIELTLGPPTDVSLEAGSAQSMPLTLVNFSQRVHWFTLEVSGIPRSWWTIEAPGSELTPDGRPVVKVDTADWPAPTDRATAKAKVTLKPPRGCDAPAGVYPLLVIATSRDNRRLTRTTTGELVVKPFVSLSMKAGPPTVRGRKGMFRIEVENNSNVPVNVALDVTPDKKLVGTLSHADVPLDSCAHAVVDLELRMKRWQLLGQETARAAVISARAEEVVVPQTVSLSTAPLIPRPLQRFVPVALSPVKRVVMLLMMPMFLIAAGFFWLFPPDVRVTADTPLVASGGSTTVSWSVQRGRGEAVFEGPAGAQEVDLPSGRLKVNPDQTFDYKITAKNLIGLSSTGVVKIQVLRVLTFTAATEALKQPGDPVTLQWTTENATTVALEPAEDSTALPINGKAVVHPRATTTYRLIATNDQFRARTVAEVQAVFGAPRVTQFQQDKLEVFPGDPVLLTWVTDGSSTVTLKGGTDDLELKGGDLDVSRRTSIQVRPVRTGQYVLVAANSDGTTTEAQLTIRVLPIKKPRLEGPAKPISAGETTTLKWLVEGANDRTTVFLQPDNIDVTRRTSLEVRPLHTTEYTLVVTGADGQPVSSDVLRVPVLPSVQEFRVAPASVVLGEPVSVSWNVLDAQTVTITRDDGTRVTVGEGQGSELDHPGAAVTSYFLKARNATGESIDSPLAMVKITVQQPTPTPAPTATPVPTPIPATPLPVAGDAQRS